MTIGLVLVKQMEDCEEGNFTGRLLHKIGKPVIKFSPCGTRTRNLRIRSPTPCPLGQGGHRGKLLFIFFRAISLSFKAWCHLIERQWHSHAISQSHSILLLILNCECLYSSVVERQSCKLKVLGSIPSGGFSAVSHDPSRKWRNTRGGTRNRNLFLRGEAPYPLGHTSYCFRRAC